MQIKCANCKHYRGGSCHLKPVSMETSPNSSCGNFAYKMVSGGSPATMSEAKNVNGYSAPKPNDNRKIIL